MDIRAKKSGIFVEGLSAVQAEVNVGSALYKIDCDEKIVSASNTDKPVSVSNGDVKTSVPVATKSIAKEVTVVRVPVMGESITTGILAKWIGKIDEVVAIDQVIGSIETDKVTVDVRSPFNGRLSKFYAVEGQEVNVDENLFEIVEHEGAPLNNPVKVSVAQDVPAVKPVEKKEVDMTNLIELRNKYKEDFEKIHGVKLGFMSAFVRASASALLEIPAVNAVIDDATNEIVYRNYIDISVAVASPTGLVVPVLRNTEKMTFADIEKSIGDFGKKAKAGSLSLEDMTGGTFTISNGGVFGSLFGTPIINPPQSAILGMHATKMRPVVINGKVEARPMMYLALTYDHRMVDGREAVTFLKSVASKIEDPGRLLLSV
eukprot:gene22253-28366_t